MKNQIPDNRLNKRIVFFWILFVAYAFVTFATPLIPIPTVVYVLLVVSLGTTFAIVHGVTRYGGRSMVVFITACLVISNFLENLSISTGFPFGFYHYSQALGPKLFAVPVLIGPAYFGTGYLSWVIADVLLDKVGSRLNRFSAVALPVIASFVMVMWDVVMDPSNSTLGHNWIWQGGGGFFGVPLSNYVGWFFTVYLFFQVFSLHLWRHQKAVSRDLPRSFWLPAILLYLVIALSFMVSYAVGMNGSVVDAAGQIWSKLAIRESSVIVSLFTMCFVSVLAIVRLVGVESKRSS